MRWASVISAITRNDPPHSAQIVTKDSNSTIDEMAIVDILTKLIFDADSVQDDTEQLIIHLLAQQEPSIVTARRRDISEYLRAMGVDEMIHTVANIKEHLEHQQHLIAIGKANQNSAIRRS